MVDTFVGSRTGLMHTQVDRESPVERHDDMRLWSEFWPRCVALAWTRQLPSRPKPSSISGPLRGRLVKLEPGRELHTPRDGASIPNARAQRAF